MFFGGDNGFPIQCSSNPNPMGELWFYDVQCAQWTLIDLVGDYPGARTRATGVLDTQENRLLVFGGRYREGKEGDYDIYNDVWALSLDDYTWQELQTSGNAPSPRWSSAGVYDPIRHRLIVTTGNDGVSGAIYNPTGDTFALDLATNAWSTIGGNSDSFPPARLSGRPPMTPCEMHWFSLGGRPHFSAPCSMTSGYSTWTRTPGSCCLWEQEKRQKNDFGPPSTTMSLLIAM